MRKILQYNSNIFMPRSVFVILRILDNHEQECMCSQKRISVSTEGFAEKTYRWVLRLATIFLVELGTVPNPHIAILLPYRKRNIRLKK